MRGTRLTLRPGQPGTKKWVKRYGEQRVCVRYSYDEENARRYKTVELIVEQAPWQPEQAKNAPGYAHNPEDQVGVRVGWEEKELREAVRAAGGIWRPRQKLWELRYEAVVALGLEERVVVE